MARTGIDEQLAERIISEKFSLRHVAAHFLPLNILSSLLRRLHPLGWGWIRRQADPEPSHTQQSHSMGHHQQNRHNKTVTTDAHPTKTG